MKSLQPVVVQNNGPLPAPFRMKDLMLGELLCQSGILTDQRLLELASGARKTSSSLGAALVYSGILTSTELFIARRVLYRYLQNPDGLENYLETLNKIVVSKADETGPRSKSVLSKRTGRLVMPYLAEKKKPTRHLRAC